MGRRWDRFWDWMWHGHPDPPARWPCPKCGTVFAMGSPPVYDIDIGVLMIPWTDAELKAKCPTCHPDKATQVETTGSD